MKQIILNAEMETVKLISKTKSIFSSYNGIDIRYSFSKKHSSVELIGYDENVILDCFYLLHELFAIACGYFFEIKSLTINGENIKQRNISMYTTDKYWKQDCFCVVDISDELISAKTLAAFEKYSLIDNGNKNMTGKLLHSFFYILSEAYHGVLIDHKLTLALHVCDGIAENANQKGSLQSRLNYIFSAVGFDKFSDSFQIFDIKRPSNFIELLQDTRHEITHFVYKGHSASIKIETELKEKESGTLLYLYLFYIVTVCIRIRLLKQINNDIECNLAEQVLNGIYDWAVEESQREDLDFKLPINQFRKLIKELEKKQK